MRAILTSVLVADVRKAMKQVEKLMAAKGLVGAVGVRSLLMQVQSVLSPNYWEVVTIAANREGKVSAD